MKDYKIFINIVFTFCYYNEYLEESMHSVLEVLVDGQLAHCFWACGKAEYHGVDVCQSKTTCLMTREPRKGGAEAPLLSSGAHSMT